MEFKLGALILLALVAVAACDLDPRPALDYLHSEEHDRSVTPENKDLAKSPPKGYGLDYFTRAFIYKSGLTDRCKGKNVQVFVDALFLFSRGDVASYVSPDAKPSTTQAQVLKHGKELVDKCLDKVTKLEPPSKEEFWMDKMLAKGKQLNDEQLLAEAKSFDLMKGKLDVKGLLAATMGVVELGWDDSYMFPHASLRARIQKICEGIREHVNGPSMIYNLLRLLKPDEASALKVSARFLKLNEYHRICLPWSSERLTEKALDNLSHNSVN